MSSPIPRPDILLVTATDIETNTLIDSAQSAAERRLVRHFIGDTVVHDLGQIGNITVCHLQCEMGNVSATAVLTYICTRLQPDAIVMLGIAAGLKPAEQQIGDILVAEQVRNYEMQRVGASIIWRGRIPQASRRLLRIVRSIKLDLRSDRKPLIGLLLSGEKLVDQQAFADDLLKNEPRAIGLDMESYGLAEAATETGTDWLVIKAISDFANGEKNHPYKDEDQKLAATNAVAFVLHLLNHLPPRESALPPVDSPPGDAPPEPTSGTWSPTSLPGGRDDQKTWADLIAAGEYPIAKEQKDETSIRLSAFRIGRYAVTVGQYRQFIAAGGYGRPDLWSANGWKWRKDSKVSPPDLTNQAADLPLTGVSWYEALAFCAWLNADHAQGEGWAVCLPTEAEWEVAAKWSAVKGRMVAWEFPDHPPCQNVIETAKGGPVAVTSFAEYASPCGAVGMAGNVWEWCSSSHEDYPADATIPLSDLSADTNDAPLRGGAYNMSHRRSSWDARTCDYPIVRRKYRGFRLCLRHAT